MRASLLVLTGILLIATGCRSHGTPAESAGRPPALGQLAVAWSGGQAMAECRVGGPAGAFRAGGEPQCVWAPAEGSGALGAVTGYLDDEGQPELVMWDRPTTGAADADRLVDSLGAVFVGHGLTTRDCGSGSAPAGETRSAVWESPTLIVHLSRITPDSGAPRLAIIAIDQPDGFPDVLCPRAATS